MQELGDARYEVGGLVGRRIDLNQEHWLLTAPQANPGMLAMLYDRDRLPRRDLVPWAGEFVGKYLTSAVLCYRLTRDPRLARQIERFVESLVAAQDDDGYLGPFPRSERLSGTILDGRGRTWDLWGHYHANLGLLLWRAESGDAGALHASISRRRPTAPTPARTCRCLLVLPLVAASRLVLPRGCRRLPTCLRCILAEREQLFAWHPSCRPDRA
jgi:hypothetical protein